MGLWIAGAMAGAAGALLTQTTQLCRPDPVVPAFCRRAGHPDHRRHRAALRRLLGAFVFLFMRDWLAAVSPVYWYFWIGLLLVVVVSFFRRGILPTSRRPAAVACAR